MGEKNMKGREENKRTHYIIWQFFFLSHFSFGLFFHWTFCSFVILYSRLVFFHYFFLDRGKKCLMEKRPKEKMEKNYLKGFGWVFKIKNNERRIKGFIISFSQFFLWQFFPWASFSSAFFSIRHFFYLRFFSWAFLFPLFFPWPFFRAEYFLIAFIFHLSFSNFYYFVGRHWKKLSTINF